MAYRFLKCALWSFSSRNDQKYSKMCPTLQHICDFITITFTFIENFAAVENVTFRKWYAHKIPQKSLKNFGLTSAEMLTARSHHDIWLIIQALTEMKSLEYWKQL